MLRFGNEIPRGGEMAAYDYVIVGAGSAGCVLAARLTEDPDVSVLLLEAGPPDVKENIHVPAAFGSLFKTDVDWDYATAPEDGCNGRMMYLPRGKVLGGSSSINAMVYIRGAREDYDAWRDAGNPGWGYDDLLPLFKRSEDNERGESEYHGVGGPLSVTGSTSARAGRSDRGAAAAEAALNSLVSTPPAIVCEEKCRGQGFRPPPRRAVRKMRGQPTFSAQGRLPITGGWTSPRIPEMSAVPAAWESVSGSSSIRWRWG
jgi:choline dehydrogenase-like flavoprotein